MHQGLVGTEHTNYFDTCGYDCRGVWHKCAHKHGWAIGDVFGTLFLSKSRDNFCLQ